MSDATPIIKRPKYSQREVDFILHNLKLDGYEVVTPNDANYLGWIIDIKHSIDTSRKNYFNPAFCLVSDESISWLEDDLRAALWFYTFLVVNQNWSLEIIAEHTIFSKDLILSFDSRHVWPNPQNYVCRHFDLLSKNLLVRRAMSLYSKHKISNKHLSWLNRKNQEQMDWAIDYLQEKELLINAPTFLPVDTKEYYAQICASLDALDLHINLKQKIIGNKTADVEKANRPDQAPSQVEPSQEQLPISSNEKMKEASNKTEFYNEKFINESHFEAYKKLFRKGDEASDDKKDLLLKMRTAWNQKVFREKKPVKSEKKLKLPHGYEKKLNIVAEAYGENMVTYLKTLIDKEYNNVKSEK